MKSFKKVASLLLVFVMAQLQACSSVNVSGGKSGSSSGSISDPGSSTPPSGQASTSGIGGRNLYEGREDGEANSNRLRILPAKVIQKKLELFLEDPIDGFEVIASSLEPSTEAWLRFSVLGNSSMSSFYDKIYNECASFVDRKNLTNSAIDPNFSKSICEEWMTKAWSREISAEVLNSCVDLISQTSTRKAPDGSTVPSTAKERLSAACASVLLAPPVLGGM